MIHRIILENGEIQEVPFTAKEIAEIEATEKIRKKEQAEEEAKATKRAELLSKLGITEEEARILLG